MELPGETVQMEQLVAVEGENTLRRIGAGPFWEVLYAMSAWRVLTENTTVSEVHAFTRCVRSFGLGGLG